MASTENQPSIVWQDSSSSVTRDQLSSILVSALCFMLTTVTLMFTSLGVAGMWWGMIAGILLQTVILIILTMRTDWDTEVEKAIARVKSEDGKPDLVDNI